jgi:hypothetical protein
MKYMKTDVIVVFFQHVLFCNRQSCITKKKVFFESTIFFLICKPKVDGNDIQLSSSASYLNIVTTVAHKLI